MKPSKTAKKSRPVLSICMIVKNEEKNLERCLRSLRPLMEGVQSELIITDTGSEDHTVEIAKEYTDHVIHYEWCDDFAAARNVGLEAAKGEWAMAIDADEELADDLSELIRFFNSDLRRRYVRASGIMKNSVDARNRDAVTNEQNVNHFFRMDTHPRYEGRIHETVKMLSPCYQFGFMGYHYGYAYENEAARKEKMERNMALLRKDLEENPRDMRLLLSALESVYDQQERLELIERVAQETPNSRNPIWMISGYKHLAQEHMDLKQWEKVLVYGNEFEKSPVAEYPGLEIVTLDIWYAMSTAAFCLQRYEEGVDFCDRYLSVYRAYERGELDRTVLMYVAVDSFYDLRYNKILLMKTEMLYRLSRNKEAAGELEQVREKRMDSKQLGEALNLAVILMQQKGVELPGGRFYRAVKQMKSKGNGWSEAADLLYLNLEGKLACCTEENKERMAAQLLRGAEDCSDDFTTAMKLLCNMNSGISSDEIKRQIAQIKNWDRALPDIYYISFRRGIELPPEACQINMNRMQVVTDHILSSHKEELHIFDQLAASAVTEEVDCFKLTLLADMLEKAVRMLDKKIAETNMDDEQRQNLELRLLQQYSCLMERLLGLCYQPTMLSDQSVLLMPVFHQRGYWIGQVFQAMEVKDLERFGECIKNLVEADRTLKPVSELLLREFERQERQNKGNGLEKQKEFNALAEKVKESIRGLIKQREYIQAGQLLLQLRRICPEDEEIRRLLRDVENKL